MPEPLIKVIIPAHNEAESIAKVIREIPAFVEEVVVVNNASTDKTAYNAQKAGATVLHEPKMGYGYACLKGLAYLSQQAVHPDIIVFLDGDYSDYPKEMERVVAPILTHQADFVVGARAKELQAPGSMTFQQRFGNALATTLMRWFFGSTFTDLGPFRAIRYPTLVSLQMEDKTYGWTVEMQLKALKKKVKYTEVKVSYKKRIGQSKVSGTIKGTIFAGYKILSWIFKYSLK